MIFKRSKKSDAAPQAPEAPTQIAEPEQKPEEASAEPEPKPEQASEEPEEKPAKPLIELFEDWIKNREGSDEMHEAASRLAHTALATIDSDPEPLFSALYKASDYDRAVAEAELKGRNTAIEEKVEILTASDGLPHLPISGSVSTPHLRSIFDLARSATH